MWEPVSNMAPISHCYSSTYIVFSHDESGSVMWTRAQQKSNWVFLKGRLERTWALCVGLFASSLLMRNLKQLGERPIREGAKAFITNPAMWVSRWWWLWSWLASDWPLLLSWVSLRFKFMVCRRWEIIAYVCIKSLDLGILCYVVIDN